MKVFFTITGMNHYFGLEFMKPDMQVRLEKEMQRQDNLTARLDERFRAEYEKRRSAFATELAKLTALDPMRVLLRGYARATDGKGRTVDSVNCVNIEDEISIAVSDGTIRSVVTAVDRKGGENDGGKD